MMKNGANVWSERRVGVLGLGRSGRAATRLLAGAGAEVYASDRAYSAELRAWGDKISAPRVEVELGGHDVARLETCDVLVVSPGIAPTADVLQSPEVRGIPLISEIELAYGFIDAPLIAVTGTNGKTTTTAWIGSLLQRAGLRVGVGGNIGLALSELAAEAVDYEWIVVEVSSFQLVYTRSFKPAVGVLLNLYPDHIDWHGTEAEYYAAKRRLFENADADSRWVLNGEDSKVLDLAAGQPGTARHFRVESPLANGVDGAYLAPDGMLVMRIAGQEIELVAADGLKTLGLHNVANALASSIAASYAQVPTEAIRDGLRDFEPLPHRLQPVAETDGVLFINDSKATNVASARVALRAMDRPVVLLLGGRAKGESFASLIPEMKGRVRSVIAFGEAGERVEAELDDAVAVIRVQDGFADAVRAAAESARPGDVVLLAPACASFDMFRDYEERGARFAELARQLVA
ncbi:MAG: UDP-N-acetylmuramoyl-L-alanine--D-glutamate ligase [Gemmatimonadetes bacterium]|uniref:UDP-N-acetylmuramoylalanine--D-glutamate ligase n=1 Tax=Candidatus Kutchimonas denitrificans TaxID=3056748 RepID=A0AAE4Z8C4_9BACT|nr:UDP-N-acetylmuramoyl-L-alanine--D-glutamate ligase [Gemmatimonadota bacterium]NIR74547.1 UDP-N-acetylmuramoyl-L-alanine--D-glutamate ligase [Candidatus Kutchimonas denitrificans]NIS02737.1 UDP-N-acetylmuramoyl-L-alanine--D-glutamate ligase [Gemmatimonadota bacterium]NIT68898.1 UDP-N-acetylmuramoyl-L-alanine--D-glutamate ligase [Gemmatimonadota bacterium]NIU52203.1 UDP-N-acetylmuramoyl-L-alanine--D-glutamate ligase [Gemmatimonadota bacterium]